MPNRLCGNTRRRACRRNTGRNASSITVITDQKDCCEANSETLAEELYKGNESGILMLECCDESRGCRRFDARRRCEFWPKFAHPRWLSCRELYDKKIC